VVMALSDPAPNLRAMGLTDRQRDMLTFERGRWNYIGAKETAIRERFGCSATRYYQELRSLLDQPEALQHDPQLVNRLRRLRDERRRQRAG
jgi:hypothetical protein